jgi:UDP-MurNAc hydroxylase
MKIVSLNNATTLVSDHSSAILIDPWLVGDLYAGAWSPSFKSKDLSFLDDVTDVLITHIHEDHWDMDTIKLLRKSTNFYLPDMKVNGVIMRKLTELGFNNIYLKKISDSFTISSDFESEFIPPLNSHGQEIGNYHEGYAADATNIDTGVLIKSLNGEGNHLFLCDNSPYDIDLLTSCIKVPLVSLWYPFNSYAMDWPVCYNLDKEELDSIHSKMNKISVSSLITCIEALKPDYVFPHSADFVLNGKKSEAFLEYVDPNYMDRRLVAKNIESHIPSTLNTISTFALPSDELDVINKKIEITRDCFDVELIKPHGEDYTFEQPTSDISEDIALATINMFKRLKGFGIELSEDTSNWVLELVTDNTKTQICLNEKKLKSEIDLRDRKILSIFLSDTKLAALLNRDLHWNNAQIGYHLSIKRNPNEFSQDLYKALNFLHK